ncbi:MFS transporter [Phreatobacter stygius]|uniref:MFS transporter n=1 Tax=Phreatobacter stygius TaxID=1940610 RepID=A0A4D7B1T6_9HYPH|nr:MFS transporter [Phreatobacter stygius]QCI64010.1 MFS transporter [Phreatobacter stygius]
MSNPYREIFRAPGAKAFSAAGFIARLPLAMITLGIVTMLSQARGGYWLAGAVAATFAFANALISPQVSRLVDRYGQSRVLPPATALAIAALAGLMLATRFGAPAWALFLFAMLAGFMPSMSALVRARWTELYRDTPKLRTAFAFESVVDEVIYMTGPVISIGLSVAVFPEAGPLAATLFLAVGTLLFVPQKATEPLVHAQGRSAGSSVIRLGSVRIIALTLIAIGAIFGTAEVTAVAFAEQQGHKAAASFVLASYAAGSLIVGLVFGALKLQMPLARQLLFAIGLAALTTLPLLVIGSIPVLAAVLFLAGAAVSPTIIISIGLIERLVPAAKLTEGITWAMTGIGIGMAIGSSLSGWVIDEFGAASGFWVSIAAGGVALATVLLGYRHVAEQTRECALAPAVA